MEPLKIAVVGLGTVGVSTLRLIRDNKDYIRNRSGRDIEVVAVSARRKGIDRGIDLGGYYWSDDPEETLDNVDVLVELIGGSDGMAYRLVTAALSKGVSVVTANKALIAHHGYELACLAEANACHFKFEASVAGAIPALQAVRQGLAANHVSAIHGIVNGTCNYILTQMRETGASFSEVLKDAQDKGFAEVDPTFDVDGVDAGHKISILAAIAFATKPDFSAVHMSGIRKISKEDNQFATDFGYKIKLIGSARVMDGRVLQTVEPCFVPVDHPFSVIEGANNAVLFECDYAGSNMMTGLGAGGDASASSVVGDLISIARNIHVPPFGVRASELSDIAEFDVRAVESRYYLRLSVLDKVGVLADVSSILRDHNISVGTMLQKETIDGEGGVNLLIITHQCLRHDVDVAMSLISRLDVSQKSPCIVRIEDKL